MNWGRAKTILIILFLVIDILLLCMLSAINNDLRFIDEKTISDVVSVLNSRGITISKDIIPSKRIEKKIISLDNVLYQKEAAAKRFLGDSFEVLKIDNEVAVFKKDLTTVEIKGNEVLIENERDINPASSYEDVKALMWRNLEDFGFKKEEIGFGNAYIKDGVCHIVAYQAYEGYNIRETKMLIEADSSGILRLSGRCFSLAGAQKTGEMMYDITSALINMVYDATYSKIEVKKIDVMYYIDSEYIDGTVITASPVYVVTDTENREFILKEF